MGVLIHRMFKSSIIVLSSTFVEWFYGFMITELDSFEDSIFPLMMPASALMLLQKIWIKNVN